MSFDLIAWAQIGYAIEYMLGGLLPMLQKEQTEGVLPDDFLCFETFALNHPQSLKD